MIWTIVACGTWTQIDDVHNYLKPSLIKSAWIAESYVSKMTEFLNYKNQKSNFMFLKGLYFGSKEYTNVLKAFCARLATVKPV